MKQTKIGPTGLVELFIPPVWVCGEPDDTTEMGICGEPVESEPCRRHPTGDEVTWDEATLVAARERAKRAKRAKVRAELLATAAVYVDAAVTPAELHAWLVAQWQAKLDVARASERNWQDHTSARWYGETSLSGPHSDAGLPETDAAFIIAWPPSFAIAVCEAALRRLERHEPDRVGDCKTCHNTYDGAVDVPWPCPEALDAAAPFADQPDFPEELKRP